MGQLIKLRTLPAVDNHTAAAPNAGRLGGPVSPSRIARTRQGAQLATGSEGTFVPMLRLYWPRQRRLPFWTAPGNRTLMSLIRRLGDYLEIAKEQ
jgi:hypothetical protein